MSPATLALVAAAIQAISDIINQLSQGKITDAQAEAYLQAAVNHYRASRDAWDAAGQKGA